jgi:hypothetical protein
MSPGSLCTDIATINSDGQLNFARDAERDLNFTWQLGLELSLNTNISNYSGITVANKKQHIPVIKNTKWQHCYFWNYGEASEYQKRRLNGPWLIDAFKTNSNKNTCCVILLESENEMPLEKPITELMQSMAHSIGDIIILDNPAPDRRKKDIVAESPQPTNKTVRFDKSVDASVQQNNTATSPNGSVSNFKQNMLDALQRMQSRATSMSMSDSL